MGSGWDEDEDQDGMRMGSGWDEDEGGVEDGSDLESKECDRVREIGQTSESYSSLSVDSTSSLFQLFM